MKNLTSKILLILSLIVTPLILTGCKTTNPQTGQAEYNKEQSDALKAALELPVKTILTSVLLKNKDNKDIPRYVKEVGAVFCEIKNTKQFDPSYVVKRIGDIVIPQIDDPTTQIIVLSVKDSTIAIYKIFYAKKASIIVDETGYLYGICEIFCNSFDGALKNSGNEGIL